MKIHRIEICILNDDDVSEEEMKYLIENVRYPNHCLSPKVRKIETRDVVGEWHDDHPLNKHATFGAEYARLFAPEQLGADGKPITFGFAKKSACDLL